MIWRNWNYFKNI